MQYILVDLYVKYLQNIFWRILRDISGHAYAPNTV